MTYAVCLKCGQFITLRHPKVGLIVNCQNCWTEFEIVSLQPLELEWAELSIEEYLVDWQEEDYEDINSFH